VYAIDETLPNSIKREHPRKGEKKKQGASTEVQAQKRQLDYSIARY
jgi:hypothetical protein